MTSVHLGLPPASHFSLPPYTRPLTIPPPPPAERSWTQPFDIPPALYHQMLDPRVPVTVALVYAVSVVLINRVNKKRGYKPWAISRTRLFKGFVVLHNVFLAVYSAWTFVGMIQAFVQSWPDRADGNGVTGVVDALCKVNGPRGLGNAAIYNTTRDAWTMSNPEYSLGPDGQPDPTDVGRLWNRGLAFFGWIFYLSKFYEVLDTAIILAKGKKSSTLQTYHHAGAMMCMWAGIRYMASPIWIFALVNSGIHALMYTYYALTAMAVRIPVHIKRSLTTVQIVQFIIGTALAASHLFVSYTVPVAVPHPVALRPLAAVLPANRTTEAAASLGPWLKKLVLRAAGAEGVAANVANMEGARFGSDGLRAAKATVGHQEMRSTLEPRTIPCIDTSGQAFAVWLNVLYLLPLTYLFARFFVRSYLGRRDTGKAATQAEAGGLDALKGASLEVQKAVIEMHADSGVVTESESGRSTPQRDVKAYEANIEEVMTAKQQKVEEKAHQPAKKPRKVAK